MQWQHVLFSYSLVWQLCLYLVHPGSPDLVFSSFYTFPCLVGTNILLFIPCPKSLIFRTTLVFHIYICSHFFGPITFLTFMGYVAMKNGKGLFHPLSCPFSLKAQQKPVAQSKVLLPYPLSVCCLFISTWGDGNGQYYSRNRSCLHPLHPGLLNQML